MYFKKNNRHLIAYIWRCMCAIIPLAAYGQTYNVTNFGAKGDGLTDDTKAIQECFKRVEKNEGGTVYFPKGTYIITEQLDFFLPRGSLTICGEGRATTKIKNKVAASSILSIRGYYSSPSNGAFRLENIALEGNNKPYSTYNRLVNTKESYFGVKISDLSKVYVSNVSVRGIYGEGIMVHTTKLDETDLLARFDHVTITNNWITDCWGHNPKADDYGDGIYIANVARAEIKNNKIINNFDRTRQLGRCGIVLEYFSENCILSANTIFGYDRGIHLEDDFGGHKLLDNNIMGSDLGIVVFNKALGRNFPIEIVGNYVTNKGLPKGNRLKKTRGVETADRSLLNFYSPDGARNGSRIENNMFVIDGSSDYSSQQIVNLIADGLLLRGNSYIAVNKIAKEKSVIYNDLGLGSERSRQVFHGITSLKLNEEVVQDSEKVSSIRGANQLNGAEIIK